MTEGSGSVVPFPIADSVVDEVEEVGDELRRLVGHELDLEDAALVDHHLDDGALLL